MMIFVHTAQYRVIHGLKTFTNSQSLVLDTFPLILNDHGHPSKQVHVVVKAMYTSYYQAIKPLNMDYSDHSKLVNVVVKATAAVITTIKQSRLMEMVH